MLSSGETPRSPDFRHDDSGAPSDHNNSAVVVPSEETPMEGVTAGPPDAPMEVEHGGHHDAPPVVQGGGGAPAGSTTAAPPQPPRLDVPTLERALHRCRIKLGKQKVPEEASTAATAATAPEEPPRKKLMHDGIRAAAAAAPRLPPMKIITYVVTAAAPERKKMMAAANGTNDDACNGVPPPPPPPPAAGRFHNLRTCSVQLRRRLEELDATEPEFVCEKMLQKSDVHLNQNRLLVSCKPEVLDQCPITYIFTDKETHIVHAVKKAVENGVVEKKAAENGVVKNGPVDKEVVEDDEIVKEEEAVIEDKIVEKKKNEEKKEKPGLKVTVFDRSGNEYGMTCRYLDCNGGYRFIGEWGKFLKTNGMAISRGQRWSRNVVVKLLEFRSRKLPRAEQSDHPDGALGFVVLHHENRRSSNDDSDDDDDDEEYKVKAAAANPKKKNNGKKEPVKAATSPSPSVSSASAAADVAPKREVSVAPDVTRSLLEQAVQGILKLGRGSGSSSSSPEYNGSKSSDKEEKTDD